jgi:hypothetical protein
VAAASELRVPVSSVTVVTGNLNVPKGVGSWHSQASDGGWERRCWLSMNLRVPVSSSVTVVTGNLAQQRQRGFVAWSHL